MKLLLLYMILSTAAVVLFFYGLGVHLNWPQAICLLAILTFTRLEAARHVEVMGWRK